MTQQPYFEDFPKDFPIIQIAQITEILEKDESLTRTREFALAVTNVLAYLQGLIFTENSDIPLNENLTFSPKSFQHFMKTLNTNKVLDSGKFMTVPTIKFLLRRLEKALIKQIKKNNKS